MNGRGAIPISGTILLLNNLLNPLMPISKRIPDNRHPSLNNKKDTIFVL